MMILWTTLVTRHLLGEWDNFASFEIDQLQFHNMDHVSKWAKLRVSVHILRQQSNGRNSSNPQNFQILRNFQIQ